MEASAWSSGLTHLATMGVGIGIGVTTGNPLPAISGAIGFSGWLVNRWQEANSYPSSAQQPSASVREQINSVSHFEQRSGWFQEAATQQAPTLESDEAIVRKRTAEIARSANAGTDFDNWIRAVIDLKITQRAAQIGRSPSAGSDFDNWIRAERELQIAQRAEEIAKSSAAGTDYDNWLRAEHEVHVAQRAEAIAHSPLAGSNEENWQRAERALAAEGAAICQRAEEIVRSPQTAMRIRTHVEIMLRAEEIKRSPNAGSDFDNWVRAEQQYRAYRTHLDERIRHIAASPEAALGHWSTAEQERRAEIMLRAEEIKRSPNAGSDFDNWVQAEQQCETYRTGLDERIRRIAASPEAALGHWLRAEQELRAEGGIPPW